MKFTSSILFLLLLAGCASATFQLATDPSPVPSSISIDRDFSFKWRPPIGTPEFETWISAGVYERYAQVEEVVFYKGAGNAVSHAAIGIEPEKKSGGFAYDLDSGKVHIWESIVSVEEPTTVGPFVAHGEDSHELFSYIGFVPPQMGENLTLHFVPRSPSSGP